MPLQRTRSVLAIVLAALLAAGPGLAQAPAAAQPEIQGPHLNVIIVEGEGAINNIRERTAREPIVEIQDENHKPVAGAAVVFTVLPSNGGAGASFVGGSQTAEFVSDASGRVVARGFHPNTHTGPLQIRVTATSGPRVGSATISQRNVAAAVAGAAAAGISLKLLIILGVAAGAAAGGAYAATHGGGSHPAATTPTTITPGAPSVGAP